MMFLPWILLGLALVAVAWLALLLNQTRKVLPNGEPHPKQDRERTRVLETAVRQRTDELSDLLYAASHDLRTPLLAVLGFAREVTLLCEEARSVGDTPSQRARLDELLGDELPEAAQYIEQQSGEIDRMLTGLLKLSRLYRAPLSPKQVDITELVGRIVREIADQSGQPAQDSIPSLPSCYVDSVLVERLLREVIQNAFTYGGHSASAEVTVSGQMRPDGFVQLTVADHGPGLRGEQIARAMQIFGRLDPNGPSGEGLGLPTAAMIASRHGGRLWLESPEGPGCRCHVLLPDSAESPAAILLAQAASSDGRAATAAQT